MRPHILVRVIVISALCTGVGLAYAFSTGPSASVTGLHPFPGITAEPACNNCHASFPLNSGGGSVEILDLPAQYTADQTYTLRVRVTHTHPGTVVSPKWGFQITAVRADDGTGIGTFAIPLAGPAPDFADSLRIRVGSGTKATRRYVEHSTYSTRTGMFGSAAWSFQWTAPSSDVGLILFTAAGNAADGTLDNSGDYIYTDAESISVATVSVGDLGPVTHSLLSAPSPNPSRGPVTLPYALANAGHARITIHDLAGRTIATVLDAPVAAGAGRVTWNGRRPDGTPAPTGVYFARLHAPDESRPITRRLLLTR